MTTATASTTQLEHQPSTPASTGLGYLHLIDDHFLNQFMPLAYQSAITSEHKESIDQMALGIVGGPFQGRSRWIAWVDSSTLTVHLIRSMGRDHAKWLGRVEPNILFNQGVTSIFAEPMPRTKLTIMGAGSSPPAGFQIAAETATVAGPPTPGEGLTSRIEAMFSVASEETFVDGMDSDFSRDLHSIVRSRGRVAIDAITMMMRSERLNVEVGGEALRQIGSIVDTQTHQSRLALLMAGLESPDPRLKDAASLGIATLDDPTAIESITRAIRLETSPRLRQNFQLVLDQLQATLRCRTS